MWPNTVTRGSLYRVPRFCREPGTRERSPLPSSLFYRVPGTRQRILCRVRHSTKKVFAECLIFDTQQNSLHSTKISFPVVHAILKVDMSHKGDRDYTFFLRAKLYYSSAAAISLATRPSTIRGTSSHVGRSPLSTRLPYAARPSATELHILRHLHLKELNSDISNSRISVTIPPQAKQA